MRCALPLLLALAVLVGCGDSENPSASTDTLTSTAAAGTTTVPAPEATTSAPTPKPSSAPAQGDDAKSPFVVVTPLLGKPMPEEPGCTFAKTFVPDKPSAGAYDGALTLSIRCPKSDGYTPMGQIVNRGGSKPTEITCRNTTNGQLFCIYVPSTSVGLYFTGTDRAVVRRRLEHLIEIVQPLPTGITPLSGS